MRHAALVIDPMGVLGRAEHDKDDELFLDVVEPVLDVGADEYDRPGLDRSVLVADAHPRPAGNHVVDLVLGVGTLGIGPAGGQHVHADRQVVRPDELMVQPAGIGSLVQQVGELEGVHGTAA